MEKLAKCKNVNFLGMWTDPEGIYGSIPIFELNEPSVEEWNRRARELAQHHENKENQKC